MVYPKRHPTANSDDAPRSPWASKLVLSLDGGGVRGYSSLLILRELLRKIAELESATDNNSTAGDDSERWLSITFPDLKSYTDPALQYDSSAEYPWRGSSAALPIPTQQHAIPAENSGSHSVTPSHISEQDRAFERNGSLVRFRIRHYFDYVAGTSTGGLSALMLSRMGMDIDDALRQYDTVGNKVFAHPRSQMEHMGGFRKPIYESKRMNQALQDVVSHGSKNEIARRKPEGSQIRLVDESEFVCRTAVIAFGGLDSENTYLFRSYNRPDPSGPTKERTWLFNTGSASTAKVWKVARATSAAPRYFSRMTMGNSSYIDGGMGCNNPAEVMSREIKILHGREPDLILSIGTGTKPSNGTSDQKTTKRKRFLDNGRSILRTIKKRLPDIATDSEETHGILHEHLSSLRKSRRSDYPMYFRFNVPGLGKVELDEWLSTSNSVKPDGAITLGNIRDMTLQYLGDTEVTKQLELCAKELVRRRRNRAETDRWEQFATHTTYHCPLGQNREVRGCDSSSFPTREKLRLHASQHHEFIPWVSIRGKPLCIIDECAERPHLFEGDDSQDQLRRHLNDSVHGIKDATPMSTERLEAWLDRGRTTTDTAFQEQVLAAEDEPEAVVQNDLAAPGAETARTHWSAWRPWNHKSPASDSDLPSKEKKRKPPPSI